MLRDFCEFSVIHRPVSTFLGVDNNFKRTLDIDVVRIATGGTYGDRGRRIGAGPRRSRLRVIERGSRASRCAVRFPTREPARHERRLDEQVDDPARGRRTLRGRVPAIAENYPGIPYRRELFDALLAGIIINPDRYNVIVTPNEYGDFLSDMACGLMGSIGLGGQRFLRLRQERAPVPGDVRSRGRHGPRHRGAGHLQPERRTPGFRLPVDAPGRSGSRRRAPRCGALGHRRRGKDGRHRRVAGDQGLHRDVGERMQALLSPAAV